MNYKEYLGDLIGGGLMIRESQLVAQLLLQKPDKAAWEEAIIQQNILQKRSDASAKRNAATIRTRLSGVNDEYLEKLAFGNAEISTQLMFAATLMTAREKRQLTIWPLASMTMWHAIAARSCPARSEQTSAERCSGSIGTTRSGK